MAALFQVKQQVCPARNGHDRTGGSRKRLNGLAKGGRLFEFLPKVHRWCPSEKAAVLFDGIFPTPRMRPASSDHQTDGFTF
jgi:hypothetical protein